MDHDLAEQDAQADAQADVDPVRALGADLGAEGLLEAVDLGFHADHVQGVADVDLGGAGGREVVAEPVDAGQVHALGGARVLLVDGVDGLAVDALVGDHQLPGLHRAVQAGDGVGLRAQSVPGGHDRLAAADHQDPVAEQQAQRRVHGQDLRAALHALDRGVLPHRVLQGLHGDAVALGDLVGAADQLGHRGLLVGLQRGAAAAHLLPQLAGGLGQVDLQQPREDLAGQQHDRDQAEQAAVRVGGGHVRRERG
ncbi:hypothetical protein ABIA35_008899 [Catenulispora sp. MAP12-49]